MTSRERMLAALECREVDYVPCSFMIFAALRGRCASDEEFVRRGGHGPDAVVPLASWASAQPRAPRPARHRHPLRPEVGVRWREAVADGPDVHKEYVTPDGVLRPVLRLSSATPGMSPDG